jgi:uncharacterized protein YndB with AHSA1/START domain
MHVERSIVLPERVDAVWSLLVDWERQAEWMADADSVRVVGDLREGVGVRLAVRTRLLGVPAFVEPMEVVAWEPPRRLVVRHGGPLVGTGTWSLEPVAGGARFTWSEDVSLRVPIVGELAARGYAPVLRVFMSRAGEGLRRSLIASGPRRNAAARPTRRGSRGDSD